MKNVTKQQLQTIKNSLLKPKAAKIARKVVAFVKECNIGFHKQEKEEWYCHIHSSGIITIHAKHYDCKYIEIDLIRTDYKISIYITKPIRVNQYSFTYEDFLIALSIKMFEE